MGAAQQDRQLAHRRLTHWLQQQIDDGSLKPGDRLPGEHDLAEQHGVSRNTVRRALQTLETANRIERRRGLGTFVARDPLRQALGDLRSFTMLISDLGREPGITGTRIGIDPDPPLEAREYLPGARIWRVHRVRLADGARFAITDSWVPDVLGRRLDVAELEDQVSLYRVYEHAFGITVHEAREAVRAELAGPTEAALLEIEEGAPIIVTYRHASDTAGVPVEYARIVSPGERFEYVITLRRM